MMQRADSRLRNAPVGRKGKGTVDRIIDAAADLLESRGYEALTTNHIAEAAGVNIATLYKYFANKEAILTALHLRLSQRWKEALTHRLDQIRDGAHWREIVCQIIDVAAERRQGSNGAAGMRIAMKVSLELQPYDRAESIESAQFVADMLIARAGVDAVTAARVGRVAIEVGAAVLDLLLQDEATDDAAWVGEAKAAICNYLAPYFEDSAPL
jgi:AcrR family transcriptional regulator